MEQRYKYKDEAFRVSVDDIESVQLKLKIFSALKDVFKGFVVSDSEKIVMDFIFTDNIELFIIDKEFERIKDIKIGATQTYFKDNELNGLIIDLRGNGGGSLAEALELTGFFIDEGPVVQTKDATGRIEINYDPQPGIVYPGPLAVLVDRDSASASEIFAGAIQDYRRGIIIGETTFGKGTVQNVIDLNRFIQKEEEDYEDDED